MTGHGGDQEANHGEFSSNKSTSSFLGKIVRFNIDSSINGKYLVSINTAAFIQDDPITQQV
jgi:hypothetical protein